MRLTITLKLLLLSSFLYGGLSAKPRILVFTKANGSHCTSIAAGISALKALGRTDNFRIDTTTSTRVFTYSNLKKYAAVIFLNISGDVLDDDEKQAFKKYIRSGRGFVGIHAATDVDEDWPWYGEMLGANFGKHVDMQMATLNPVNTSGLFESFLPAQWKLADEWYNFKWISKHINVVLTIDESSYTGGTMGSEHPMSWFHNFQNSHVFVTALGHNDALYKDNLYLQHLQSGINYALGRVKIVN